MIAAIEAEPDGPGCGEQPPWAEGSVPLRSGAGEAAERELRLGIVAARRRRARRARVAAVGGVAVVALGGTWLIVASLGIKSESVSGSLVLGLGRPEPVSVGHPQGARIGQARALTTLGRGERKRPATREHALHTPEAAASAPAPEPTYVAPEPEPEREAAPPAAEPAPASPEEPSQGEFGFEH